MSDIAIRVEDLGKLYRLGEIGTGTLSHDLNRWWARLRGQEDPFAKIGETNDRTKKGGSNYVWALQDVNFEVKQGEVLGIIGRNGAGKSTLLKILSKVTTPSKGRIKVKGRIASLLEVGTGFHPELTGRENIFLNGAILGMTKAEIRSKFDEIVDFAGVERYIDTPVKRYSSGMYVRLAFAVAAFLEPEILILDEVLAVGDSEFQKKCITRMEYVARKEGRTILFVSHDLKAIGSLCNSCLFLKNGNIHSMGPVSEVIKQYVLDKAESFTGTIQINRGLVEFEGFDNETELDKFTVADDINISLNFCSKNFITDFLYIDIGVYNEKGDMVIHSKTKYIRKPFSIKSNDKFTVSYKVQKPNLVPGEYNLTIYVYEESLDKTVLLWIDDVPAFIVNSSNPYLIGEEKDFLDEIKSYIYPKVQFDIIYDKE